MFLNFVFNFYTQYTLQQKMVIWKQWQWQTGTYASHSLKEGFLLDFKALCIWSFSKEKKLFLTMYFIIIIIIIIIIINLLI